MKSDLGDRMKEYEDVWRMKLPRRMPLIIRLDGKAFHTLLRNANKPFDNMFTNQMVNVVEQLMNEIQNAVFAYCQSDEISILVHNYKKLNSEAWFDNNLQKIVSVSASIASSVFEYNGNSALFDSRVFILPEAEVCNYFIWRQQDAIRNSINSVGQFFFSDKELHGKNTTEVIDMLEKEKNILWKNVPIYHQRGFGYEQDIGTFWNLPKFSEDRNFINDYLKIGEE